jgi:hypothetical protein
MVFDHLAVRMFSGQPDDRPEMRITCYRSVKVGSSFAGKSGAFPALAKRLNFPQVIG